MPKVKQAIVLVNIYEEGEPQASGTLASLDRVTREENGIYIVEVYPNYLQPSSELVDSAAHELGHVLASLFQTPAHIADPRRKFNSLEQAMYNSGSALPPPSTTIPIVAAEAEAWDFAQKMWPDLDPEARKASLDTYKEAVQIWKGRKRKEIERNPDMDMDRLKKLKHEIELAEAAAAQ